MGELDLNGLFGTTEIRCSDPRFNYRRLEGWHWFLYRNFGRFRFVRKLIKGMWEFWPVSPGRSAMWLPVLDWSTATYQPPFTRGDTSIAQEEWPKPPVIRGQRGPYR